jgi:hypothetical protein
MSDIYLLVKTHRVTGLKYLCQTKQDPKKYKGSGTDWRDHVKKFGNNVDTEIIKVCVDKCDLKYWGRYYSTLWNVVTASDDFGNKIWANAIPETGGGPGFTSAENSKYQLEIWANPEHVSKMSDIQKETWTQELRDHQSVISTISQNKPEVIEKHRKNSKKLWEDPQFRADRLAELAERWKSPDFKTKMEDIQRVVQNKPEVIAKKIANQPKKFGKDNPSTRPEVAKQISNTLTEKWKNDSFREKMLVPDHPFILPKDGKNNPRYDHSKFMFSHVSGISDFCTKAEVTERYGISRYKINKMISDETYKPGGWSVTKARPLDLK